ncbi:ABC transporter permease [Kibdelosporangium phytohabitans]|uniref:Serine protease n=1 Tax=Kibdelosporangium phytohabitans TaxID=860235 RepID=A0A0N9IDR2_9PSEU|nr:ABC transporter permease [Kibdelosporangium phytohabitans]ALG12912.1 serine protease [Kibdelosporangium phytohabitans]MBE1464619.1 ribose transport system permease protein/erythritol transport system permease protein [Kibdelosporangium phytohabitans]
MKRLVTDRVLLLVALLVVLVVWMSLLGANGYLVAPYDVDYLLSSLESVVPLCLLGVAELLVIVSGRGGIDLSVGAMVSLVGMAFGFMVGDWHWPVWIAIIGAVLAGAVLGAVNGFLVAWLGVPALIATLATYYAFSSLALVSNDNAPISTQPVQDLHSLTSTVGQVPTQVFTFLLPCVVLAWLLANRTNYGRRLYAIGTNEAAARFAGLPVVKIRFRAYVLSGALSAVVAVITVAQFASARPDAGTVGNGMALPAITIAILGGTAITGGIGRIGGVVIASLFVVWLNAGILLAFEDSRGSQYQLLALGAVLVASALLNRATLTRRE